MAAGSRNPTARIAVTAITVFAAVMLLRRIYFAALPVTANMSPGFSRHPTSLLDDSMNQTLGFQKIYILSMPDASNRRDGIILASAMTGLTIEFIDGVSDFNASKDLPKSHHGGPYLIDKPLNKAQFGSWRAHVNAIQTIVRENLTSALIIEDDADWDIGIKEQMRDFARATRLLLQPLRGTTDQFLDPSVRHKQVKTAKPAEIPLQGDQSSTAEPTNSPYGDLDRWDILWPGHCGMDFPSPEHVPHIPSGRVVQADDATVIQTQHFRKGYGSDAIVRSYPNRTRITSHIWNPLCNLGYGLSQQGARRLLFDMGWDRMTSTTDQMLKEICNGENGFKRRVCIGVQPPLFVHHYRGKKQPFTANIKFSTKVNLGNLVDGHTNYTTNWPDDEPWRDYPY